MCGSRSRCRGPAELPHAITTILPARKKDGKGNHLQMDPYWECVPVAGCPTTANNSPVVSISPGATCAWQRAIRSAKQRQVASHVSQRTRTTVGRPARFERWSGRGNLGG